MGNLLKLLSREDCPKYDVFVDFEYAQPTESEKETFDIVEEVLVKSKDILYQLQTYKGAANEIREAIINSNDENSQIKVWQTLVPLIERLVLFYEFSIQLQNIVPQILLVLCSGEMTPREHLETQQAIVKQLAEILDFVFRFDDMKMNNPSIQNDLSYYRRTINRRTDNSFDVNSQTERLLSMSLFYAQATPMLKVLSDTTTRFVRENSNLPIENTIETLNTICQVCQRMIENPEFCSRFKQKETIFFVRVMTVLKKLNSLIQETFKHRPSSSFHNKVKIVLSLK